MAAITSSYELVFILKPDLGEEATASIVEKFKTLISENGTIEAVDEWGKRRLAYPIDDQPEGYYVQINFNADNVFPTELYRQLKITDGVLRSLVVKKEIAKKAPKAEEKKETVQSEA